MNTTNLIAAIEQAFTAKELRYDLQYRPQENRYIFFLTMGTSNGRFSVACQVLLNDNLIMWMGGFPANVPETRRERVALYLNQNNWQLNVGNWEMDSTDGELRFRYAHFFDPELPMTEDSIMRAFACVYTIMNENMNPLLGLMFGPSPEPSATLPNTQPTLPFWCN